ncbi:hypothetical protein KYC5002_29210 [Archangium violaceum]|uniref:hypothetical protein n=1 Tax=Archangium violaceum TaxID=83451 RepID=UPI002B287D3A|nr:hypothetical protein KYC5002_29210 [Archangium gephyra]
MADLSTDIEALQAAHDAVAEQASLTLRWRLALLLLLTVSLTAAWNGIRTGEAAAVRKRIQALDPLGDWDGSRRLALYDLDPIRDAFAGEELDSHPVITRLLAGDTSGHLGALVQGAPPPRPIWEEGRQLREAYRKAFVLTPKFLDVTIPFDLRLWLLVLPVIVIGSEVHVRILRRKRAVLQELISRLAAKAGNSVWVTTYLFVEPGSGRRTAFARHPSQVEEGFSALAMLVIVGYVLWGALPYWNELHDFLSEAYFPLLALLAFWCLAYVSWVGAQLEEQLAAATNAPVRRGRFESFLHGAVERARRLGERIGSRRLLAAGGLAVLASTTGGLGRRGGLRGWEILTGSSWPPPFGLQPTAQLLPVWMRLTTLAYVAALGAALLVLATLILRERAPAGMRRAAAPATLLAFSWFLVMDARIGPLKGLQPLSGLLFLMPAIARVAASPGPEQARMWRSALAAFYAPFFLVAWLDALDDVTKTSYYPDTGVSEWLGASFLGWFLLLNGTLAMLAGLALLPHAPPVSPAVDARPAADGRGSTAPRKRRGGRR